MPSPKRTQAIALEFDVCFFKVCFKRWWSFCCCTFLFVSKDDVSYFVCWAQAIARCYSLQSTSLQPGVPKDNSTTCQGFLAYHAITQQPRCGQIMLIKSFVCHVGKEITWNGHPIFHSNIRIYIYSHFWECTMYPGHLGRLAIWHHSVFLGASTHPWVSADIVVGLLRQRLLDERTIRLASSGPNVLCNVRIAHQEQFSRNQNQPCFGHVFDKIGVYNVDKEVGTWNLKWVVGTDRKVLGASEIGKKWKGMPCTSRVSKQPHARTRMLDSAANDVFFNRTSDVQNEYLYICVRFFQSNAGQCTVSL